MSVRNGGPFLRESMESIFRQDYPDLEIIVVDDGSDDATPLVLSEYRQRDSRLRVLTNTSSRGLPASLNRAIDAARGFYLARMDADDLSLPDRIRVQVDFMQQHGDVGILGGWVRIIGTGEIWRSPEFHEQIHANLPFANQLFHPTVMFRASVFAAGARYSENFANAQDYELWTRLSSRVRFHNLQRVLLDYRLGINSATGEFENTPLSRQKQFVLQAQKAFLSSFPGLKRPHVEALLDVAGQRRMSLREIRFAIGGLRVIEETLLPSARTRDLMRREFSRRYRSILRRFSGRNVINALSIPYAGAWRNWKRVTEAFLKIS